MKEIWKDIKGYEGIYQVSNTGKVKRIVFINNKVIKKQEKILRLQKAKNNYIQVGLSKDNISKKYRVHRLVAEAFIPNTENKEEVNHIDGNKDNNCVTNLEWCTPSENMRHAIKTKLLQQPKGIESKKSYPIIQYRKTNNVVEIYGVYGGVNEASKKTKILKQCIISSIKGRQKSAGKYLWKYIDINTYNDISVISKNWEDNLDAD